MRILMWDVHGGYSDALTLAPHDFCFLADESGELPAGLAANGLQRLSPRDRAANLHEVTLEQLRDEPPDLVLAQRTVEADACAALLRRRPGHEVGAVFLEHNTPRVDLPNSRHPLADRPGWAIVHVTHFNQVFWDCGTTPTHVIEHGVPDPGRCYTGELARLVFVVNEPVRRWRVTGSDLLVRFADRPIDAYGIDGHLLPAALAPNCPGLQFGGNLSNAELLAETAERRAYLHLNRWTSLGLSLIESMLLGLPVLVLETTEAARAVPRGAGARSTDVGELARAADELLRDPDKARVKGRIGRAHALDRYSHPRFVAEWTACFERYAR